jgi:hypothetical protein
MDLPRATDHFVSVVSLICIVVLDPRNSYEGLRQDCASDRDPLAKFRASEKVSSMPTAAG